MSKKSSMFISDYADEDAVRSGEFPENQWDKLLETVDNEVESYFIIPKANRVLDCSGLLCPLPIIKVSKTIKQIEVGQVLQMIATDPGSPLDMVAWSRLTGNDLLDSHKEGGKFIFYFRRVK